MGKINKINSMFLWNCGFLFKEIIFFLFNNKYMVYYIFWIIMFDLRGELVDRLISLVWMLLLM